MTPMPTMLRELRSLRLRLGELAKQDEEALATERHMCETRLELVESLMKLQEPLMACLTELGYPRIAVGSFFIAADAVQRDARRHLDRLKPLLPSDTMKGLNEIEQEIERKLEQWQ